MCACVCVCVVTTFMNNEVQGELRRMKNDSPYNRAVKAHWGLPGVANCDLPTAPDRAQPTSSEGSSIFNG